jgi:hypothetical protein
VTQHEVKNELLAFPTVREEWQSTAKRHKEAAQKWVAFFIAPVSFAEGGN